MPASMMAQDNSRSGVGKYSGFAGSSRKVHRRLDGAGQRHKRSSNPIHSIAKNHILHGFSLRILRKPEDSLANNSSRLSIFCSWTRACIVLLAFGTSLLCSASSWSHAARAPTC